MQIGPGTASRRVALLLGLAVLAVVASTAGAGQPPVVQARNPVQVAAQIADASATQPIRYFLKIDTIKGESTDESHKDEIVVESFSWGTMSSGTAVGSGQAGAGKATIQDFHFVIPVSTASPSLMLASIEGRHFNEARFSVAKVTEDGAVDFLTWRFTDVVVSSYQTGASQHGEILPTDEITLNFAKVEVEYRQQKADGSLGDPVKAGWDVQKNQKV